MQQIRIEDKEMSTQCPLINKCKVTGMNCAGRNYDGNQATSDPKWQQKEPCNFYLRLIKEKEKHPRYHHSF
jgi:hypothetical protein